MARVGWPEGGAPLDTAGAAGEPGTTPEGLRGAAPSVDGGAGSPVGSALGDGAGTFASRGVGACLGLLAAAAAGGLPAGGAPLDEASPPNPAGGAFATLGVATRSVGVGPRVRRISLCRDHGWIAMSIRLAQWSFGWSCAGGALALGRRWISLHSARVASVFLRTVGSTCDTSAVSDAHGVSLGTTTTEVALGRPAGEALLSASIASYNDGASVADPAAESSWPP